MRKFYEKISKKLDDLPDAIPEKTREKIKDAILGDKELKDLMDGIDSNRPPRLFLIGRTGVGKSSLINAICGSYVARVSDTVSCTKDAQAYTCECEGRVLLEVFDTRGIAETVSLNNEVSAEDMLIEQINAFSPDIAIFMLSCTHRDDVISDVEFLKKVSKVYMDRNHLRLPVVVVVNRADEMAPTRIKEPEKYPVKKVDNINEMVSYYKGIIVKNGLKIDEIIAVSSLLEWETPDGVPVSVEEIDNLPQSDIDNLVISFDGRYQIDKLLEILMCAIQDFEAQMGLRMAVRLNEVVDRVANHLINVLSTISGTIALSPIPISDIYILLVIQSVMVSLIGSLSGRDMSLDSAKEFICGLGGVSGLGFFFRFVAQQGSKLVNLIVPGAGSVVSATIAAGGTKAIGEAAKAYYIDEKSIKEAKAIHKKAKKNIKKE